MREASENPQRVLKFVAPEELPPFLAFGTFVFDTHQRRLTRDGSFVPLTPKTGELLLLLLQSRGQLVEKEKLIAALWPDSFVEESNLTQNVSVLRKALGDGDYIETIPRRGYRFAADVHEVEHVPVGPRPVHHRAYWAATTLAVVAIAVLAGTMWRKETTPSISSSAYESYLKGRHHWNRRTSNDFQKAVEYFRFAVEEEPRFALAWAGLADAYNFLGQGARAKVAGRRALEIDEGLAQAHAAIGFASLFHDFDWRSAEYHLERAIELNPSYASARHWYAFYLVSTQRYDEALAEIEQARRIDPLSIIINTDIGMINYYARRYDEAIAQYRKALNLDPSFAQAHLALAHAYMAKGNFADSSAEFDAAARFGAGPPPVAELFARQGDLEVARAKLAVLEKQGDAALSTMSHFAQARSYVAVGDPKRAVASLERAYRLREGEVSLIHVDPGLDPLRKEPGYIEFLTRRNLQLPK